MLGHFGGSNYAYKPSGIITYSSGPWGGARAAIAIRPLLSGKSNLFVYYMRYHSFMAFLFQSSWSIKFSYKSINV